MNKELNEIFLPSTKKENDDLIYETTSEYVSSDAKTKLNKKILDTITKVKIITRPDLTENSNKNPDNKEKSEIKSNRIIINKRSILLIKGKI